jgi:hypothetical protein
MSGNLPDHVIFAESGGAEVRLTAPIASLPESFRVSREWAVFMNCSPRLFWPWLGHRASFWKAILGPSDLHQIERV